MMINKIIIGLCFVLLSNFLFSQGLVEVPLHGNAELIHKWGGAKDGRNPVMGHVGDVINLTRVRFLDDFSKPGPFPDTAYWLNNSVYINRGYPKAPPTIGVATFDGVNQYGYPYDFLADPGSSGKADTLLSKMIRLDSLAPVDSLYFSFYYQPQGRGNSPESADSLILEFKKLVYDTVTLVDTIATIHLGPFHDSLVIIRPLTTFSYYVWEHMWAHNGYPLGTTDSTWHLVMLPITDTSFFKKDFQFRFTNWATLSGAGDQWNIDYVYLNRNRNAFDTLFQDVSFVYDAPSLLKPYTAMPWRQYDTSFIDTSLNIVLRNDFYTNWMAHQANVALNHSVYDVSGSSFLSQSATINDNVLPYDTIRYYTYRAGGLPLIPGNMSGPRDYIFTSTLNTTPDFDRNNDTLRRTQSFGNYYSYDDGSAEEGFAILGSQSAELAVQFTLQKPDTLRDIDIYFDPLWTDESLYTFNLKVWANGGGQPGALLFTDTAVSPAYTTWFSGPNNFIRYKLSSPMYLTPQTFYVGYAQNTVQGLNVGVDKNTNSQYQIFYTIDGGGTWYNSPYQGSVMIHPVFGTLRELDNVNTIPENKTDFSIYPNPANDRLFLNYKSTVTSAQLSYSVIDVYGRTILHDKLSNAESIDISMLSEGVYFIQIVNDKTVSTNKFIKLK